ncbi:MAG: hypothetical protein K2N74_02045, partial [Clostridiales bacterium]|nr:hypothetical protein [Clostridiales bacterium]
EDYGDDVKQTAAMQFTAVNAGTYTVVLSLTNKDDCVWDATGDSKDYEFDFEIKPKTVTLNIASLASEVTEGYTTSAQIELLPITSGTLRVILTAYYQNNFIDNLCAIDLSTANTHFEAFTLETVNLISPYTYDLQIDYDDPDDVNARNHKIVLDTSYTITVKEPSLAGGLNWRLTSGGSVVGNKADPADTNSTIYTDKISYNGKSFSFTVNAAGIGYSVDTAYGDNDFTSGYKTVKKGTTTPLSTVTNAGTYVTTVHLTNGTDTAEYSIEWTIDKAKFDLSGVRWLPKNGEIEYSDDMSIVIDPDTLPAGLSVKEYDGSYSVSSVGQNGQAIVIFKVADSDNYVLPVSTDSTTYIFKAHDGLTDFEWKKDWEVVPAEIPVVWTVGTVTASGNKKTNAKMLDGGYDAYLDYVYYESDSRGNVAEGATPVSELSIVE